MRQENMQRNLIGAASLLFVASGLFGYLASHWPLVWQLLLAAAAACLAGGIWVGRADLKSSLGKRTVRYGLNSVVMSAIVFAIVVILNLIAVNHDQKLDVTRNKLNTLSDQSIKIVKGLTQDVKLRAFVNPQQKTEFDAVFDKYAYYSKHIQKDFIDVDRDPLVVRRMEIKQPGTIIVESATRSSKIDNLTGTDDPKMEEKITNAIIQVVKGDKKKIYFVNGHGERLIGDTSAEGYSGMRDALGVGRFNIEEINLVEKDKIPADAEIVIIPGPKKDFMTHEIASLENYVKQGGKLFVMMEPDSSKALQPFLAKYGVAWKDKRAVVERNNLQQLAKGNPLTPIVVSYDGSHDITRDIKQMSIFAITTPVEKADKVPEGMTATPLFFTSKASQESNVEGNRLNLNDKTDRKGPLSLAVAIVGHGSKAGAEKKDEKKEGEAADKGPEFRMIVVGDSDFGNNQLRGFGANSDLFQNMLSWLAKEEDLISIRPKPTDESTLDVTEQRMRVITLASCIFMPFAMLLSGIAVWLRRRRL